jgi:CcmD family protein
MRYLCLAFAVTWLIYFAYLFYLDGQLRGIRRRLDAREKD